MDIKLWLLFGSDGSWSHHGHLLHPKKNTNKNTLAQYFGQWEKREKKGKNKKKPKIKNKR